MPDLQRSAAHSKDRTCAAGARFPCSCPMSFSRLLLLLFIAAQTAVAQEPEWIWHSATAANGEVRFFRKTFQLPSPITTARLLVTCDNRAEVFVNGKAVAEVKAWQEPMRVNVKDALRAGENVIAIKGRNEEGIAGLIAKLELTFASNQRTAIVTDTSWLAADREVAGWNNLPFVPAGWTNVVAHGKLGTAPWGNVFATDSARPPRPGPATELTTLPGFSAEMVHA